MISQTNHQGTKPQTAVIAVRISERKPVNEKLSGSFYWRMYCAEVRASDEDRSHHIYAFRLDRSEWPLAGREHPIHAAPGLHCTCSIEDCFHITAYELWSKSAKGE